MRLFVAVTLPEEIKAALTDAQKAMVGRGLRGNYAPAENLHLTLAFIGEYPSAEPVMNALASVRFAPFPIALEGIGCFGDLWWAGIKDSAPLSSVARRVRRALAEGGIPFDRKGFSPHITLVRRASKAAAGIGVAPAGMTVDRITLMRSDPGKKGMIYTELGSVEAVMPEQKTEGDEADG